MKNPRLHHEYRVEFLDHVSGGDEPMRCVVWGRLAIINKDFLVIDVWGHLDEKHTRSIGNDVECFCILRSTITDIFEITDMESLA